VKEWGRLVAPAVLTQMSCSRSSVGTGEPSATVAPATCGVNLKMAGEDGRYSGPRALLRGVLRSGFCGGRTVAAARASLTVAVVVPGTRESRAPPRLARAVRAPPPGAQLETAPCEVVRRRRSGAGPSLSLSRVSENESEDPLSGPFALANSVTVYRRNVDLIG